MYLRELCGREEGAPPPVDLIEERENGDFVRALILDGTATAAHDLSDGGLAVALAEMAMASGIGATLDAAPDDIPAHAYWFGEDQARYLVTVPAAQGRGVLERARAASVLVSRIGTTGGDALTLPGERPMPGRDLARAFEGWLPAYMAGEVAGVGVRALMASHRISKRPPPTQTLPSRSRYIRFRPFYVPTPGKPELGCRAFRVCGALAFTLPAQ